jgi:hypothetical protein
LKRGVEGAAPYRKSKNLCPICLHFDFKMQTQDLNLLIFAKTLVTRSVNSFCARQGSSQGERLGVLLGYFLSRDKK